MSPVVNIQQHRVNRKKSHFKQLNVAIPHSKLLGDHLTRGIWQTVHKYMYLCAHACAHACTHTLTYIRTFIYSTDPSVRYMAFGFETNTMLPPVYPDLNTSDYMGWGVVGRGLTNSIYKNQPRSPHKQRHICRKITSISRLELSRNGTACSVAGDQHSETFLRNKLAELEGKTDPKFVANTGFLCDEALSQELPCSVT